MDSWRRQRSDSYNNNNNNNQEVSRTRSQNRKPPLGNWQPTVPSWEKKFCTVVGSVPWPKVMENKKFIHLYDNVLKWNDSAGEEAFLNAKNRFWAELNGLPCDVSLPDPDIYIDKIDWNSNIDPELLLDLEREFVIPDDQSQGAHVVILSEPVVSNHVFSSTGWGDAEVDLKKTISTGWGDAEVDLKKTIPTGWGDTEEDLKKMTNSSAENRGNPWEGDCFQANKPVRANGWDNVCNDSWYANNGSNGGWEDGWNNSRGWNQSGNNYYENTTGVWEPWDANDRNQTNSGGYMSRYKTSRFHGDDHVRNQEWRRGKGGKRANFSYEQPWTDKRSASRKWNLVNSFEPVNHQGSAKPGNQWSWE